MDGPPAGGLVLAVDHDRLFKELLTTFFCEFLDLFFPQLAAEVDRTGIEFLSQELFPDLLDGGEYHADILAKARFKDQDAYFLIHVEHQSDAPSNFPRRFFRYFSAIFERHGLPVYPVVVYSHGTPEKAQPDIFKIDFPDGPVLRFHYRVVQLNRLPWRRFVDSPNPVASALMAKMKLAERERPRVKAECLRLMVTLKLDRARMRLIASFVDTYLKLNPSEEREFAQSMGSTQWTPQQKEAVVEIVTSWEQRGIEKGFALGRKEAHMDALRSVLLDLLSWKFGPVDESMASRVEAIDSADRLKELTHQAVRAQSLQDLSF